VAANDPFPVLAGVVDPAGATVVLEPKIMSRYTLLSNSVAY